MYTLRMEVKVFIDGWACKWKQATVNLLWWKGHPIMRYMMTITIRGRGHPIMRLMVNMMTITIRERTLFTFNAKC